MTSLNELRIRAPLIRIVLVLIVITLVLLTVAQVVDAADKDGPSVYHCTVTGKFTRERWLPGGGGFIVDFFVNADCKELSGAILQVDFDTWAAVENGDRFLYIVATEKVVWLAAANRR